MENLEQTTGSCAPMSGFARLWFTAIGEVAAVAYTSLTTRAVSLTASGSWGAITAKKIQLTDNESDGVRSIEITCSYRGVAGQTDTRLSALEKGRYLVKLKDRNGKLWLAGDKETPLHFSYDHTADADAAGLHEYQLRFYGTLPVPVTATV